MAKNSLDWLRCDPSADLARLVGAVVAVWPQHEQFLRNSFDARSDRDLLYTNEVATLVHRIAAPDLVEYATSYRWTCKVLTDEVLPFRKTGRYRRSSFATVDREVYQNAAFMTPYLRGLLLSQVLWWNHAQVIAHFIDRFLPGLPMGSRYLEMGPGHGLFLALAARSPNVARIEAWDLSPSALAATSDALTCLGAADRIALRMADVTQEPETAAPFDAVVVSEVLEHLEDPAKALSAIARRLSPRGKAFINVPVNSPAPDHIFLLDSPEMARSLVAQNGLEILEARLFPVTGYSETEARADKLTISCVFEARRV